MAENNMSFLFPTLLWIGLPLIAVPVVIHLLHRGKQQRVLWAAMQFLVESQRKYQRWINLKQFLLLLARMAVVAVVAILVAQPLLRTNWAAVFSQRPVLHLVLLDDSYSMTESDQSGSAWSAAIQVLDRLAATSADQASSAQLSVLRFSDLLRTEQDAVEPFETSISRETVAELQAQLATWQASETDAQLVVALTYSAETLGRYSPQREVVIHILSDFRRRDWQDTAAIVRQLELLAAGASGVELVHCARNSRENLAITELVVDAGVEAADVEMWFQLSVQNNGQQPSAPVMVDIVQDGRPQMAVSLGKIAPGETASKRFRATFAGSGDHWLAAQLEPDAVALDNARYYAARLPEQQRVLLVDGTREGLEATFLATALAPGGRAHTGWETIAETPAGLTRYDDLSRFAAVVLLSVPRLPNEALDRLEDYVHHGGGLWITIDDTIDREFYNSEFYRGGKGALALPLKFPAELEPRSTPTETDLVVGKHSALRVLTGARNDYLPLANVRMFYETRAAQDAIPADVNVLASVRNGAPLMVEKRLGQGVAISQFSRLSPAPTRLGSWGNLAVNPAFPVLANELTAYLARSGSDRPLFQVGDQVQQDQLGGAGLSLFRVADLDNKSDSTTATSVDSAGRVWQSGLFRVESNERLREDRWSLLAVNVAPHEGELAHLTREELDSRLGELSSKIQIWTADSLTARPDSRSNGHLADVLLVVALGLLVSEQALAYWTSYHRRPKLPGAAA